MKVVVIPIVIGELGTILKDLIKRLEDLEIKGQEGTLKTTTLLRLAKILKILETCCHSNSRERPSANPGVNNFQGVKYIYIYIYIYILLVDHGNLLMVVFILIYRSHPYRWPAVWMIEKGGGRGSGKSALARNMMMIYIYIYIYIYIWLELCWTCLDFPMNLTSSSQHIIQINYS